MLNCKKTKQKIHRKITRRFSFRFKDFPSTLKHNTIQCVFQNVDITPVKNGYGKFLHIKIFIFSFLQTFFFFFFDAEIVVQRP